MMTNQPARKRILIDGVPTSYLDLGEGEPIVALHGIPTSSLLFLPMVPFLGARRLIAPDLLGQGETESPPEGPLGFVEYYNHLCGFMNAVAPRRFHLLVHDLGAVLGLEWAADNADRLESLTILSTTLTSSIRVGVLIYAANLIFGRSLLRWGMRHMLKRSGNLDHGLIEEWSRPWSRRRVLRGTDHFSARHLNRIRSRLSGIRSPVLLIWGGRDDIFPLRHAAEIVKTLPHAKLRVIEGCGHWLPLDAPDEVARILSEFLSQSAIESSPRSKTPE